MAAYVDTREFEERGRRARETAKAGPRYSGVRRRSVRRQGEQRGRWPNFKMAEKRPSPRKIASQFSSSACLFVETEERGVLNFEVVYSMATRE